MYNGRGSAEDRANMVVVERRKLSEKIGCDANNFSSLKKVSASPLLHHNVGKGYYEGMVPRSLDCCQCEAHRQHILWHYLLAQMHCQMGFVFIIKSLMQNFLSLKQHNYIYPQKLNFRTNERPNQTLFSVSIRCAKKSAEIIVPNRLYYRLWSTTPF